MIESVQRFVSWLFDRTSQNINQLWWIRFVEAVCLTGAVYGYLRVGPFIPDPAVASIDNRTTAEMTAAVANGSSFHVWLKASTDPWLRYVPQGILAALLPLGRVSIREAAAVTGMYVLVVEAIVFPLGAYLIARIVAHRTAATVTSGIYAFLRLVSPSLGFGSIFWIPLKIRFGGNQLAISTVWGLFGNYLPHVVIATIVPLLLMGAVLAVRRADETTDYGQRLAWMGAAGGALIVPILFYSDIATVLDTLGQSFVRTEHQYLALAPAWTIFAIIAATLAITPGTDSTRWAVGAGISLGIAGSIQIGQGTYAALAIAVIYAHHRHYWALVATTIVSFVLASPNLIVAFVNINSYSQGFHRVLNQSPPILSMAVVITTVFGIIVYGRQLFEPRDYPLVALATGVWLGVSIVASLFWWWADPTVIATQPIAVAIGGMTLVKGWDFLR